MKIKQIESILKGSKNITVLNSAEGQWLGNGAAYYPVYNLPRLTKEHIFAMFDIPEDKKASFSSLRHRPRITSILRTMTTVKTL